MIAGCALSLVAAGCSKDAPAGGQVSVPSAPAPVAQNATWEGPSACTILDRELAKKYLGEVNEPTENTDLTVSNCSYSSSGGTIGGITLLIKRSMTDAAAKTEHEGAIQMSKTLSGVDPEMVSGLGDQAYWAGGKLNQLNVFKGNDWYIISAFMDGYTKDKAIEIMKDVLAKS